EASETTRSSTHETSEGNRAGASEQRGDPVSKLRSEKQTGSEISGILHIFGILSQLSEDEIPGVLSYAGGLVGEQRQEREIILFGALTRWAQFDPAAAAEWTRANAA